MFSFLWAKKAGHPAVDEPNWKELKRNSVFLKSELRILYARFCDSVQSDGLLSKARFMFMPELAYSPFAALAFHYEAEKSKSPGEGIDFQGFVNILSHLSPKADPHDKVEYMCAVLKVGVEEDVAASRYMHKEEISSILYQLCLGTVPPPVLEQIMDQMWETITAADPVARTRGITKNDLAALFSSLDLDTFLTVPF